jgi:N-acetylmuramoyl-L-alanine amidase
LKAVGAVITWNPGERYVLITTSEPQVISFSVGDRRYDIGPVSSQTSVAPYFRGDEVYLPLNEVLYGLDLAPKRDGADTVLQPQLAAIDVHGEGSQATLVAHGAGSLHARVLNSASDRVVYEFDGVGSTLAATRVLDAAGVRSLQIATEGTPRDPKTIVTVLLMPGTHYSAPRSNDGNDFEVAFGGGNSSVPLASVTTQPNVPEPVEAATPTPNYATAIAPTPTSSVAALSQVTGVFLEQSSDTSTVTIDVSGNTTYEWHRLRAPDNRFWIDIENAQMATPPQDQQEPNPVGSLRVHQENPTTVRVALSLAGQNSLSVVPSLTGLTISVGNDEVADAEHEGHGNVGTMAVSSDAQPDVTPAPLSTEPLPNGGDDWKFGARSSYVPTNPRLIVIDPGHGGSDIGASHGGLNEATITLDMAKRLRDILVAQGWQVQLTRTTDVDVFAPNDTAHEELQARVDVANNAGARLFVSIHANSFINSGPNGITVYYAKPSDEPFARIMDRNLGGILGVKDDGIVKSHLYVTLHSFMPAILIETAFLSNPNDFALLSSSEWRQKVAQAIAAGIGRYTEAFPVSGSAPQ